MRNTIWKLVACLVITMAATVTAAGEVNPKALRVDSVTIDSVWNSDSSFYDAGGILQQRTSRDLVLSFTARTDSAETILLDAILFSISFDSGKTWNAAPNPLRTVGDTTNLFDSMNVRRSVVRRVLGGDRENAVLRITARASNERDPVDNRIEGSWYRLTENVGTPTGYEPFKYPVTNAYDVLTVWNDSLAWGSKLSVSRKQGFYAKNSEIGDSILGMRYHPLYWYSVVTAPAMVQAQALCIQNMILHVQKPASGVTLETADNVFCRAADTTLWR